jgi:hypothetical protein
MAAYARLSHRLPDSLGCFEIVRAGLRGQAALFGPGPPCPGTRASDLELGLGLAERRSIKNSSCVSQMLYATLIFIYVTQGSMEVDI